MPLLLSPLVLTRLFCNFLSFLALEISPWLFALRSISFSSTQGITMMMVPQGLQLQNLVKSSMLTTTSSFWSFVASVSTTNIVTTWTTVLLLLTKSASSKLTTLHVTCWTSHLQSWYGTCADNFLSLASFKLRGLNSHSYLVTRLVATFDWLTWRLTTDSSKSLLLWLFKINFQFAFFRKNFIALSSKLLLAWFHWSEKALVAQCRNQLIMIRIL